MPQLEIPWQKVPSAPAPKNRGLPYLVNTTNQTFRIAAVNHDDALEQARTLSLDRRSCTTVYETVDGACGPRVGAFDAKGQRFL